MNSKWWLDSDIHKENLFLLTPSSTLFPPTKLFLNSRLKMSILRIWMFVLQVCLLIKHFTNLFAQSNLDESRCRGTTHKFKIKVPVRVRVDGADPASLRSRVGGDRDYIWGSKSKYVVRVKVNVSHRLTTTFLLLSYQLLKARLISYPWSSLKDEAEAGYWMTTMCQVRHPGTRQACHFLILPACLDMGIVILNLQIKNTS